MTPRWATFAVFAVNGAMVGTWVANIPWLQERLGVSKTTIGLCLLCGALGALLAMPLTGALLHRRPSGTVTRVAALTYCLLLPIPLSAPSAPVLAAFLFGFGAIGGAMDVSMNAHAVAVEKELDKPIMSSLHGGWSVGGFAAAGLTALRGRAEHRPAPVGADPRRHAWFAALYVTGRLGDASTHEEGPSFALPSRGVLLVGVLCCLAMVTEGAIGDWSGIYLRQDPAPRPRRPRPRSPASASAWRPRGSAATGSTSASARARWCAAGWRWSRSRSPRSC